MGTTAKLTLLLIVLAFSLLGVNSTVPVKGSQHMAPSAGFTIYGWGASTTGGYGYPTVTVNTLTDQIADANRCNPAPTEDCTFRDAAQQCLDQGGCVIAFTGLSGNINMIGNYNWTGVKNVTMDCANGVANKGIQFVGSYIVFQGMGVGGGNVIVRNCRFRLSSDYPTPNGQDCFDVAGGTNYAFDHNSCIWISDGAYDVGDVPTASTEITFQNNIGAYNAFNADVFAGATRVSHVRNLYAHNNQRSPNTACSPSGPYGGVTSQDVEIVENVVYNFSTASQLNCHTAGEQVRVNFRGNIYKRGPFAPGNPKLPLRLEGLNCSHAQCQTPFPCTCCTSVGVSACDLDGAGVAYSPGGNADGKTFAFADQNDLMDGTFTWASSYTPSGFGDNADAQAVGEINQPNTWPYSPPCTTAPCRQGMSSPFPFPTAPTLTNAQTYAFVLANAGVRTPCQDSVEATVLADVANNTGPSNLTAITPGSLAVLTTPCP